MGATPRHMRVMVDEPKGQIEPSLSHERHERSGWWHAGMLLATAVAALVLSMAICFVIGRVGGPNSSGGWFNRYWYVFFAGCLFVAGSFVTCRDWLDRKPENLYLIVVLVVSMLFSWSISVREVGWDIGAHYRNILTFADWQGDVERSVSDVSIINTEPFVVDDVGLLHTVDERENRLDASDDKLAETAERPTRITWYVTSIEYLPYALTMRACRMLGLSFSRTLLLVRMTGGLLYSLVTYLGMRKLRWGKMLYAAVALIPTSVFLAAELGYSYWLFSLCLYGFAMLAGMMQGSVEVRFGTLARMLGALLLGMLPRVAYFPLMFLCLFIPTSRFSSARSARIYRGLLVGSALAAFGVWLVPKLLAGFGTGDVRGGEVNPAAQIGHILSHPGEYAHTVLRFLMPPLYMEGGKADVEGVNLLTGFLSPEAMPGLLVNYGYLSRANGLFTGLVAALLLWVTLTDKDPHAHTGWPLGVLALVLTSGVFLMIITAMYFEFTPVGLAEIHGVQRRYLIPLMYPLLMSVGPHVLGLRGRVRAAMYNGAVLALAAAILLVSWWTVCVGLIV